MKKILIIALAALTCLGVFSGCWSSEGTAYPKSKVSSLYSVTNSTQNYNIKYNLKKSLKYFDKETNAVLTDVQYGVNNAVLKRTKDGDDYKYDYRGSYTEKSESQQAPVTHEFKKYNTDKYMYVEVDGKQKEQKPLEDSDYNKDTVNKLPSYFSNEAYIDRVLEFKKSSGEKQYAVEYLLINDNKDPVSYCCWTLYNSVEFGSPGHISGMSYEKTNLLCRIFLDKSGKVTKQVVELKFKINGRSVQSRSAVGEASFELTIEYRW